MGEAIRLFSQCPELSSQLLVFSDSELQNTKAREAYVHLNIIPVIHNSVDMEVVLSSPEFRKKPLVVKLNTGMNRLGFTLEDLSPFIPRIKSRGIDHLMTHFARSSEILKPGDKTQKQYEEFIRIKKYLEDSGVEVRATSTSNSGAIEQKFGVGETFVRPGLMLYGAPSVTAPLLWSGHQTSKWVTKVLTGFQVKKGTPVGYGSNVADKDCYMAILPIGYGDGVLTYYTGAKIMVNGTEGKIFGRVNMDMTYVQFDPSAETKVAPNTVVELWNHDNRIITELAAQTKTHAYQLMCAVSSRIPRIYKVK